MARAHGFTLIELSIVLVIIGLIVGGILVGQDLIKAAEVRAQISQIEKYNSAVNTFRGKFGALPGDMPTAIANQYGFTVGSGCNGSFGKRDGDGLIVGYIAPYLVFQGADETLFFWGDLSSPIAGNLIDGGFPNSGAPNGSCNVGLSLDLTPGTAFVGDYFPTAKLGRGNYIYVYTNGGFNWYGISAVSAVLQPSGGLSSTATIPVMEAYNMDKKTDDGMPVTGVVQALYLNISNSVPQNAPLGTADTTATCYNTTNSAYSISSLANYGGNGNCAISFRFQ